MESRRGWLTAFLQEVLAMPRKHVLVFLATTVLLIVVQVEVVEGWRLIHLLELLSLMLFLYMGWVTWRVARMLRKQGKP
ncbi:MAG: hypothetical protein AB7F94_01285 [Nitrospira sp.]